MIDKQMDIWINYGIYIDGRQMSDGLTDGGLMDSRWVDR